MPSVVAPDMSPPTAARPRVLSTTAAVCTGAALVACLPSANVQSSETPGTQPTATTTKQNSGAKRKPTARGRKPVVVEAELIGEGDVLRLHFSEPLASTEGVDPNDFRLSMAMAYVYKLYAYAYYYDVGEVSPDVDGLQQLTAIQSAGDTLELTLDPPFDLTYCAEMEKEVAEMKAEPGVKAAGGLFLHYAPGERPITDVDGNAMAPVAAEWVLRMRRGGDEAYEMYFEGPRARRALREAIPIHCGPKLPPGPR